MATRVVLRGDKANILAVSEGRRLLYTLKEAMKFNDLKQLQWIREQPDGSSILVSSIFGMDTISVNMNSGFIVDGHGISGGGTGGGTGGGIGGGGGGVGKTIMFVLNDGRVQPIDDLFKITNRVHLKYQESLRFAQNLFPHKDNFITGRSIEIVSTTNEGIPSKLWGYEVFFTVTFGKYTNVPPYTYYEEPITFSVGLFVIAEVSARVSSGITAHGSAFVSVSLREIFTVAVPGSVGTTYVVMPGINTFFLDKRQIFYEGTNILKYEATFYVGYVKTPDNVEVLRYTTITGVPVNSVDGLLDTGEAQGAWKLSRDKHYVYRHFEIGSFIYQETWWTPELANSSESLTWPSLFEVDVKMYEIDDGNIVLFKLILKDKSIIYGIRRCVYSTKEITIKTLSVPADSNYINLIYGTPIMEV